MPETPAALAVTVGPDSVSVFRAGADAPILVQNAPADRRPFIHPIVAPGGSAPVTENAPAHHPWQHGLYVGLRDVNGFGFWLEGLAPDQAATDGTFHPRIVGTPSADGDNASWTVATEYRDPSGAPLLHETQAWTLTDRGDRLDLDVVWTLRALVPVTFGAYAYGGLFLRMPYRDETGGSAVNSEGQSWAEAEGRRARWVAARMPIAGNPVEGMVAVMDHPSNFRHPAPWRVDYQLGISPSVCIAGAWELAEGAERSFRHRVSVFGAPVEASTVDDVWTAFSEEGVS